MNKLRLTLACAGHDVHRALLDGTVEPLGIELLPVKIDYHPERHLRLMRNAEFDVCEFSLYSLSILRDQGEFPYLAIPVFPYRFFPHSYIFVNRNGRVREPADLHGGRVGLRNWQTKIGPTSRGILQDQFGVDIRSITWILLDEEEIPLAPFRSYKVERLPRGQSVEALLLDREIDALILPSIPKAFTQGDPNIVRLFPNPREVEERYFKESGGFPVIHTVVVRESVLEQYPWVALNLVQAFQESKQAAWKRMDDPDLMNLVWGRETIEEQRKLFGRDPWPYGLEANRAALETVERYCHEQEMTSRLLAVEDLFFKPSLLDPRWERAPGYAPSSARW